VAISVAKLSLNFVATLTLVVEVDPLPDRDLMLPAGDPGSPEKLDVRENSVPLARDTVPLARLFTFKEPVYASRLNFFSSSSVR
jgi:hypothetical protein